MRPVRQGAFDAFCGLYAVVNAVELVGITGARADFHRRLFMRLVRGLDRSRLHDFVCDGIDELALLTTAQRAFQWAHRTYGVQMKAELAFKTEQLSDIDQFFDWYDVVARDPRRAVIINVVMPWMDHWTVAARRHGRKLLVRDSSGLKSLDLQRFALTSGHYRIRAECSVVVTRIGGANRISADQLNAVSSVSRRQRCGRG